MASKYSLLYQTSKYALKPYKSVTENRAWYEMSPVEQQRELRGKKAELAGMPPLPPDRKTFKEAITPVLNALQVIGGILNIPSASLSGAVKQLIDGSPGFDAQEYFRDVFHFKEQVSWRNVIGILAEKDVDKNMWDNKWAQIVFGLTLDIVLDPLTYLLPATAWKKLSKVQIDDMMRAVSKIGLEKATKLGPGQVLRTNRAMNNAYKAIAKTRRFGIPFTKGRAAVALKGKKVTGLADEIAGLGDLPRYAGFGPAPPPFEITELAPKLWDIASKRTPAQWVDDILAIVPGYGLLRKALNPRATRLDEVYHRMVEMRNAIGIDKESLAALLKGVQQTHGTKVLETVLKHIDNPLYVDAKGVDLLAKQVNIMSKVFVDMAAGKKTSRQVITALEKVQGEIHNDRIAKIIMVLRHEEARKLWQKHKFGEVVEPAKKISKKLSLEEQGRLIEKGTAPRSGRDWGSAVKPTEDLGGAAKARELYLDPKAIPTEATRIAKKVPKKVPETALDLSPKWLMEQTQEIYSSYNAHKMIQFMQEAGLPYEDVSGLAKHVPKEVPLKKAYKKVFKEMTTEQEKGISTLIDFARVQTDEWFRAEIKAGIHVKYRAHYTLKATPGYWGAGVAPAVGTGHYPFEEARKSGESAQQMLHHMAHTMYERGQVHGITKAKAIEKAKRLLKAGKAEGYPRIASNINEALYQRGAQHYKAMHRMSFVEDMKQFGIYAGDEMIPHHAPVEVGGKVLEELKGYLFDTDTAKYLSRSMDMLGTDDAIKGFIGAFDKAQGYWKIWATSINLFGFHLRNAYSNLFLGGVKWGPRYFKPKTWRDAWKIVLYEFYKKDKPAMAKFGKAVNIEKIAKIGDEVVDGLNMTVAVAGNKMRLHGPLRKQFRMLEIAEEQGLKIGGTLGKRALKKLNLVGKEGLPAYIGETVGSLNESVARVAGVITDFADTGDIVRSSHVVQEIFVDYSNLTRMESEFFRRAIPFWSWMKQNTANQVKFIFSQPGRYAKISRFAQATEAGAERKVPEKHKPSYFKDLWMWQLPITLPNGDALFFNPNFPFQDLNKLDPGEGWRSLLTSVTPFVKTPIEMVTGYDVFRKGPIEKYPGYKAPVPGILQQMVKLLPESMKRTLKIEQNNRGLYTMNPKTAQAISNLAPFIRNTSRMLMMDPSYSDADRYFKWVSYVWGVKIKPLNELTQEYYATLDELAKKKKRMKELGMQY